MKLIHSLLILSTLSSCGIEGGYYNQNTPKLSLGGALTVSDSFTAKERSIALDICYAFKSKNVQFRANAPLAKNFTVNYKDCSGQKLASNTRLATTLKSILDIDPMVYDSTSSLPYMKYSETNLHGHLKNLCKNLFNGGAISNTEDLNSEQKKYLFFGSNEGSDHFMVVIANKTTVNAVTDYIAAEKYTYYINTSSAAGETLKGGVESFSFEKSCAGDAVETFSQKLTN